VRALSDNRTPERAELAREVERLRQDRGLSQRQLADRAGYDPKMVRDAENPDKRVPSEGVVISLDKALDARGLLIDLRKRAYDAHMRRRDALTTMAAGVTALATPDGLDRLLEVVERVIRRQVDYVDAGVVDELERLVNAAVVDYETTHSAILVPRVSRVVSMADNLLLGKQAKAERERLQVVACQSSGVLSMAHGDVGDHDLARVCALESFVEADRAKDPNLRAWGRAMQARAAYGAGDYAGALAFVRQADNRPNQQNARLALLEAQALARMGDRRGVDNAVARGVAFSNDEPCPAADERTALTGNAALGCYDLARAGRWACAAYAAAGVANKAQEHAERPLRVFDKNGLPGPNIRMELAAALVEHDPHLAGQHAVTAMERVMRQPKASVVPRITAFLAAAQSPKARNIAEIRDAVHAARTVRAALAKMAR
jgi:transcriptional regulator with XRE-family HTH domain